MSKQHAVDAMLLVVGLLPIAVGVVAILCWVFF